MQKFNKGKVRIGTVLIWGGVATVAIVPIIAAATSPLLAWRDPIYIAAGFAGIIALVLLFVQPLLAGGFLPGLSASIRLRMHLWMGGVLVAAVMAHVFGLWVTSPPDVIDALLFASPTPFSAWGVIAMWTVFSAALMAVFRRRMLVRPRTWRLGHTVLVTITVIGSVVHAFLIDGTMETLSKIVLCFLVGTETTGRTHIDHQHYRHFAFFAELFFGKFPGQVAFAKDENAIA